MKKTFLALATCLALCVATTGSAFAGSAAVGIQIEYTQILNHIELMTQYKKQVQQAITQLHSYEALKQQLQNMPASMRRQLTGAGHSLLHGNLDSLNATQRMLDTLKSTRADLPVIKKTDLRAAKTVKTLHNEGHNVTYGQYESAQATIAQSHAATYGKQFAAYKKATAQVQQNTQKIASIAASAPQIKSEVGGMQSLLQSNAIVGQQLAGIHSTLIKSAAITTQQAQLSAQANQEKAQSNCKSNLIVAQLVGVNFGSPGANGSKAKAPAGCAVGKAKH